MRAQNVGLHTVRIQFRTNYTEYLHVNPSPIGSISTNFTYYLTLFFKVLFIFPSRYLFRYRSPSSLFGSRWNLPPTLSCNPKQLDSSKTADHAARTTGLSPSWCAIPLRLVRAPIGGAFAYLLQLQRCLAALYKLDWSLHSPLLGNPWSFLFLHLLMASSVGALVQLMGPIQTVAATI